MNALNFLDANVWMALLWDRHVRSERAREWFQRVADEQFLFCRFTQLTTLRLLTTEAVMGQDVCTMSRPGNSGTSWSPITIFPFFPNRRGWIRNFGHVPIHGASHQRSGAMRTSWRSQP